MNKKKPFGQVLLELGMVSQADIDAALARQQEMTERGEKSRLLGLILVEEGRISTTDLIMALKKYAER